MLGQNFQTVGQKRNNSTWLSVQRWVGRVHDEDAQEDQGQLGCRVYLNFTEYMCVLARASNILNDSPLRVRHQGHGADGDPMQLYRTVIIAMRPSNGRWAKQLAQKPFIGCKPQTDAAQVTPETDSLVKQRGSLVNIRPREKQRTLVTDSSVPRFSSSHSCQVLKQEPIRLPRQDVCNYSKETAIIKLYTQDCVEKPASDTDNLQVPHEPGGGDPQDDRYDQGLCQHPHKGNHLIVLLPLK